MISRSPAGAALIVYGLVDRSTRDLDYFATGSDAVAGLVPALEAALRRDGLQVVRRRDAPGFVRLEVTDETQDSIVLYDMDEPLAWVQGDNAVELTEMR